MSAESDRSFARSILPHFYGPFATIRIKPSDLEYRVSKEVLCKESTYFSAMFEGKFREGQEQTTTLEEIEGVVSVQSLEAFLQWLCLRKIAFESDKPEHQISAAIELARFADMCNATAMESDIARYLKKTLMDNPNPKVKKEIIVNTYYLKSGHIISATSLPRGHEICRMLALATVTEYLLLKNFRFAQETIDNPSFGADLLQEVGSTLKGLTIDADNRINFADPLNDEEWATEKFQIF
ncbi:hypothetical protein N7451_006466 [Penicillium sp. IBT 35674x]|nr:hypothetical protein N7451_006466 [Penicillium sp. IBT 35674x]